ncbi:DUF2007 domain-containing protein [Photobacterium chitinilyticum]|uniref:DUF2007 domain-containing protein n=2 Tax=Photobacterium chitinilyticum TaxID=2485123 RepID=A0A3S3UK34_9GAMM|nr:DUF2007 domain-containing protein [Photobacterium chitinilyticum]
MSGPWIKVYDAANNLEAHSIKGMLESERIEVQLSGENLSAATGELPTDVLQVGLWVQEEQVSSARQQLERYENTTYNGWKCHHCAEYNEGQFEICWQCGHDKP